MVRFSGPIEFTPQPENKEIQLKLPSISNRSEGDSDPLHIKIIAEQKSNNGQLEIVEVGSVDVADQLDAHYDLNPKTVMVKVDKFPIFDTPVDLYIHLTEGGDKAEDSQVVDSKLIGTYTFSRKAWLKWWELMSQKGWLTIFGAIVSWGLGAHIASILLRRKSSDSILIEKSNLVNNRPGELTAGGQLPQASSKISQVAAVSSAIKNLETICPICKSSIFVPVFSSNDYPKPISCNCGMNRMMSGTTLSKSSSERLELAQKAHADYKFDDIISLFDGLVDSDDGVWCNLVGIAFSDPESRYYSPTVGHEYYLRAASFGNSPSCYNLGTGYSMGRYGLIDPERARFWYLLADKLGHPCAIASIFDYDRSNYRFNAIGHENYTKSVYSRLLESQDRGGPWVVLNIAFMCANGEYVAQDVPGAIKRYEWLQTNGCDRPPRFIAAICLAIRYYLGIGVMQSTDAAIKSLKVFPDRHGDPYVDCNLSKISRKMLDLMKNSRANVGSLGLTQQVIIGSASVLSHLGVTEKRDNPNSVTNPELLIKYVGLVRNLSDFENWPNKRDWAATERRLQYEFLALEEAKLERSTMDFGLVYNKIDNQGYPIPFLEEFSCTSTSKISMTSCSHEIFTGIKGTFKGEISPVYTQRPGKVNYLLAEDFDVVLALAFATNDLIWPSFSLERFTECDDLKSIDWRFERKEWDPWWLCHTDFGRTLYFCDQLIGVLSWCPWILNGDNASKDFKDLVHRLNYAGGARGRGHWSRVMLKPQKVSIQWESTADGWEGQVEEIAMAVDGAYTYTTDGGQEDRTVHLNNPNFVLHESLSCSLITTM